MKSIAVVALIAFLALNAHVVLAADCDNGECTSTVAVQQFFATADCSGNYTLSILSNYTTRCVVEQGSFNTSVISQCSAKAGLTIWRNVNSSACGKIAATIVANSAVGVCVKYSDQSSYINWCNQASISTNFKAVKAVANASVIGSFSGGGCNMTTGCGNNTGSLSLYNDDSTCSGAPVIIYPPSILAGGILSLDTCYISSGADKRDSASSKVVDQTNVMITCSGGRYSIISSAGGCGSGSNYIGTQSFPTDTCILLQGYGKITCPSAASALVAGPLAFIMFVVLFLFV